MDKDSKSFVEARNSTRRKKIKNRIYKPHHTAKYENNILKSSEYIDLYFEKFEA